MSREGGKIKLPNRLWLARKRRGLGQKQIAFLIEKSIDEVSRYERGIHLPELQTLLALEIVYGTPLRLLFPELYEQVYSKVIDRIESRGTLRAKYQRLLENSEPEQEYCSYEEALQLPDLPQTERDKLRSHITRLAKWLAHL